MKIETYIVFLTDKEEAQRLSGTIYDSLDSLKGVLENDGVEYKKILWIHEFEGLFNFRGDSFNPREGWNSLFLTHVNIIE